GPVLVLLAVTLGINALWFRRVRAGVEPNSTVALQIVGDLVLLAVILWLTGGLRQPLPRLPGGPIRPPWPPRTRAPPGSGAGPRAVLAVVCAVVLDFAPPLPLRGARWGEATTSHLARVLSVAALGAFTSVFVFLYASRLEELRRDHARAERLAGLGRTVAAV